MAHEELLGSAAKKRILFLHGSADLYGAGRILLSTVDALDKSRYELIAALPYREKLDTELENRGVRVMIGPVAVMRRQNFNPAGFFAFARDFFRSFKLIRSIDSEKPIDLIYTSTSAVISGALYAKIRGKKHLWHAMEITVKPGIFAFLMPRVIRFASTICVALSEAVKKYVVSGGMREELVRVVYPGVEPARLVSGQKLDIPGAEGKLVVGMVGRINRIKGQAVFVEAASEVLRECPDTLFLIAGSVFRNEDLYLKNLENMIKERKVGHAVKIIGFSENIGSVYGALDILVVPTVQPEGFGLVAAEAMSMKKPVIASDVGGLSEVVADKETGFLFPPGDAGSLKDAIVSLIRDTDLRTNMGQAGFLRQQRRFSAERYRERMERIVTDMLERRDGPGR